ncbi:hypothetical protein QPL78_14435 [Bacillus halotolerans]|uniref:hypothetical protein n=1 Tax=Bacillus halotolerans TaxID=260554 RepID=UPI0025425073|nr:hypothetical protein [Bacillus halotolerans]WIG45842.1 hypothetical protein QPL78_14435 [Bacillus halotolerans]
MNKLIQLTLFLTLIVTGCSNSNSVSSEPKEETVITAAAFHENKLEKELKNLKPVSLKMVNPLATELEKVKAKEEAEKQRQIAAAKKREKEQRAKRKKQQEEEAERQRLARAAAERQRAERQAELERQRQAALQKQQEADAKKERQAQAQRQQNEASSSNSQNAPSSPSQTDDAIQPPASELPDDDGYGYEERKKWHDDQVEWGIKQGYIDPEDAP